MITKELINKQKINNLKFNNRIKKIDFHKYLNNSIKKFKN